MRPNACSTHHSVAFPRFAGSGRWLCSRWTAVEIVAIVVETTNDSGGRCAFVECSDAHPRCCSECFPRFACFRRQGPCRSLAAAPCGLDKPRSYQRPLSRIRCTCIVSCSRCWHRRRKVIFDGAAVCLPLSSPLLVLFGPFDVCAKLRLCLLS
jgi:hypothetical protein